jgi:enamine deaminase RidA (YjgF/YER057c/UK114 family)
MSTQRVSIEVTGFNHAPQPIPAACRIGPFVVTGGIYGLDIESGKIPDDLERQTILMFENLRRVLEAAQVTLDQVIKMNFWVRNPDSRKHINPLWLQAFPDAKSRPARHTLQNEHMPANLLVQCDAMAVIVSHDS